MVPSSAVQERPPRRQRAPRARGARAEGRGGRPPGQRAGPRAAGTRAQRPALPARATGATGATPAEPDASRARRVAASPAPAAARDARAGAGAAVSAPDGDTGNTLLRTAQRARTPPAGSLAGSTRYTVPHAGQVTFTAGRLRPARGRGGGRPRTPTPAASWRNSSFPLRA